MEEIGYAPFADLRGATLTAMAESPTKRTDAEKGDAEEGVAEKGDVARRETKKDDTTTNPARGLQLSGVNLRFADMRGSYLQGTNLTDARLESADLLKARLTGAELAGAHMDNADLLGADLAKADLSGASLKGANLNQADLTGAELQYADLTGAQGLTHDALTSTRNWCNAFYASDVGSMLGLPPDNDDRLKRWRTYQETVIRDYPGAAESARVEQLSRLFPGMNTASLLGRLNDATLDGTASSDEDEPDEKAVDEEARSLASISWPAGAAPVAVPMKATPNRDSALPAADYLVVTWTIAEARAIAAVFTPEYSLQGWYSYAHNFGSKFKNRIRPNAPASQSQMLGRYFQALVAGKRVLLFKSELHFTQDGPALPLQDLLEQVIRESGAKMVVTTGTAGAIGRGLQVGDVVIASRATFSLNATFKDADFSGKIVSSDVTLPAAQLEFANRNLFQANASKLGVARKGRPPLPQIYWDSTPQPNVVVTTDYFATDDATNRFKLQCLGSVNEAHDAVLGLVCEKMGKSAPKWLSIRNVSVPQVSGASISDDQHRLARFYIRYGFWTTIQSAIATWAVIAGTS